MPITATATTSKITRLDADVIIIPVDGRAKPPADLPATLTRSISEQLRHRGFVSKWNTATVLTNVAGTRIPLVAVVSLNPNDDRARRAEGLRRSLGSLTEQLRAHQVRHAALLLTDQADTPALSAAAFEAVDLASYRFSRYSRRLTKQQSQQALRKLTLVTAASELSATRRHLRDTKLQLAAVEHARDLVNQPASIVTPSTLMNEAQTIASNSPSVTVKILDRDGAAAANFSAFLAVARGSSEEPYVLHLTYQPRHTSPVKKVALVGKGVTFDSGGLSLKPADAMEDMKIDMAGAAAVLGVFSILDRLQPAVEVHGIIAACENMPSGSAYRPSDIITAKDGTTIEVVNTDAEGRITLADALVYAREQEPDVIIDLATLTGACMVALGETHAGLMSNNPPLVAALKDAAAASGEGLIELPLPPEYQSSIESSVADLRNISTSRFGGAITAGLFLQHFVGTTPWAHLDIAGPSYTANPILPYLPKGGTGYGVRLLMRYLSNLTPTAST